MILRHAVAKLVEELYYNPECYGLNHCRGQWNLQFTYTFQPHYEPGVKSASNRNKYQESVWC
jgi:hypothetical protein